MLMLKRRGARRSRADPVRSDVLELPQVPLLITFDDDCLDAYQGADIYKRRACARRCSSSQTGLTPLPSSMTWAEIVAAQASGRWDMLVHSHAGHAQCRSPCAGIANYRHQRTTVGTLLSTAHVRRCVRAQRPLVQMESTVATALVRHEIDARCAGER